jgi:copper oxidase (laccase) domain-containing protein
MDDSTWMTFPALEPLRHRFVLRHPALPMDVERHEALTLLNPWHEEHLAALGFAPAAMRTAEQVHGTLVVQVDATSANVSAQADGLITDDPSIMLGIYVADCGAIYLHDTRRGAVGLVHSGKKGTELGIITRAIEAMCEAFGTVPTDLVIQLSPCIRPPAYEVDFAAEIVRQCRSAGVPESAVHDCGLCTSQDLGRFYSYRVEKGRTGRMLALLSARGS